MTARSAPDVVVLGLGPAGRAFAHRAAAAGMRVRAFDPDPGRRWRQTFGLWADEVPSWLPSEVVAARSRPDVIAHTRRELGREYLVLDTPALQGGLTLDRVEVRTQQAGRSGHGTAFVLDARGGAPSSGRPRQTAAGVVVPRGTHPELWMDWRPVPGVAAEAPASFLYAVPVSADALLLEETCLAGAPPVPVGALERRLRARLVDRGVVAGAVDERVDFALTTPGRRRGRGWAGAGVRGTTLHPATGYSLAASLALADDGVTRVLSGASPVTRADITAHRLRLIGLRALLALTADQQRDFFELFFGLPDSHVRAFLSARSGASATAASMAATFAAAPPGIRRTLAHAARPGCVGTGRPGR
ncbi:lycopene cyclase family protein [Tsukamurella soli]|uniref:Lycopene beta-cyclase n=1 Tax=Tsukamurella soli TaxID=644556 RepID=A0ABP8J034_9ACTN